MKLFAIALILAATTAYGGTDEAATELESATSLACADCPPDQPCVKSENVDCNTCTYPVWCVDGNWRRGSMKYCTSLACFGEGVALPGNPFGGRE